MIPNAIEEVTPDWLGEVLDTPIAGAQPFRIGEGIGLMGDIYRVTLEHAQPDDLGARGEPRDQVVVVARDEGDLGRNEQSAQGRGVARRAQSTGGRTLVMSFLSCWMSPRTDGTSSRSSPVSGSM